MATWCNAIKMAKNTKTFIDFNCCIPFRVDNEKP